MSYGPGNLPLEQVKGSSTLWLQHDQLGSTRLVTDATGTSQATYTFDSYGNPTTGPASITNPFLFGGQYQDAESGFYYLRARYYDPSTGQFLSLDPLSARTRQPYAYVSNNPLNERDPSGLDCSWSSPWDCAASAAGSVGSALNTASSAVASAVSEASQWVQENQSTVATVGAGLAIFGVACGLGIVTAETTCLVAAIGALGLGAVQMGIDAGEGNYGMLAIDAAGEFTGIGGLTAAAGTARAAFWALAGACDERAALQGTAAQGR